MVKRPQRADTPPVSPITGRRLSLKEKNVAVPAHGPYMYMYSLRTKTHLQQSRYHADFWLLPLAPHIEIADT